MSATLLVVPASLFSPRTRAEFIESPIPPSLRMITTLNSVANHTVPGLEVERLSYKDHGSRSCHLRSEPVVMPSRRVLRSSVALTRSVALSAARPAFPWLHNKIRNKVCKTLFREQEGPASSLILAVEESAAEIATWGNSG